MLNVTKTFLPPLSEYTGMLAKVWEKGWVTNNGDCVTELERQLKEKLETPHLWYCNNGTIVLQFAIRGLKLSGEIITTPFSYVATTSAILWENCRPVYADIDPASLTIDPAKIEALITPDTSAILATHVYGIPCDIDAIDAIAKKHKLKVIYDAANCFGVRYKGKPLCTFGDAATLSFHATKVFHTAEGGALVTSDPSLAEASYLMRQFGHVYDDHRALGINGKASELHAALGLSILPKIESIIDGRRRVCSWYDELLNLEQLRRPVVPEDTEYNYAYYPVLFKDEYQCNEVMEALQKEEIAPRRYFFPSLNTLSYVPAKYDCPLSEEASMRVLCLPLYPDLEREQVERAARIINHQLAAIN